MAKEAVQPTFSQKDEFWVDWGAILDRFCDPKSPQKSIPCKTRRALGVLGSPGCFQGSCCANSGRLLEASGDHFDGSVGHFGIIWGSSSNKRSKKKHTKQKPNKQQPKLQQIAGNRSQQQQKTTNIRNKQQLAANSIE